MLERVEWQMANIEGGLGGKMEDWVEHLHQTGKRQRLRHRTVQNPVIHSLARERANLRNMHPDVIAQTDKINEGASAIWRRRRLTLWECCERGSAILGNLKQ